MTFQCQMLLHIRLMLQSCEDMLKCKFHMMIPGTCGKHLNSLELHKSLIE